MEEFTEVGSTEMTDRMGKILSGASGLKRGNAGFELELVVDDDCSCEASVATKACLPVLSAGSVVAAGDEGAASGRGDGIDGMRGRERSVSLL